MVEYVLSRWALEWRQGVWIVGDCYGNGRRGLVRRASEWGLMGGRMARRISESDYAACGTTCRWAFQCCVKVWVERVEEWKLQCVVCAFVGFSQCVLHGAQMRLGTK